MNFCFTYNLKIYLKEIISQSKNDIKINMLQKYQYHILLIFFFNLRIYLLEKVEGIDCVFTDTYFNFLLIKICIGIRKFLQAVRKIERERERERRKIKIIPQYRSAFIKTRYKLFGLLQLVVAGGRTCRAWTKQISAADQRNPHTNPKVC